MILSASELVWISPYGVNRAPRKQWFTRCHWAKPALIYADQCCLKQNLTPKKKKLCPSCPPPPPYYIFFVGWSGYIVLAGTHSHFLSHCLGVQSKSLHTPLSLKPRRLQDHSQSAARLAHAQCEAARSHSWLCLANMSAPATWRLVKNRLRVKTALDPWTGKCPFIKSEQLDYL